MNPKAFTDRHLPIPKSGSSLDYGESDCAFFFDALERESVRHPRDDARRDVEEPLSGNSGSSRHLLADSHAVDLCAVLLNHVLLRVSVKGEALIQACSTDVEKADDTLLSSSWELCGSAASQGVQLAVLKRTVSEVRGVLRVAAYCRRHGWLSSILDHLRNRARSYLASRNDAKQSTRKTNLVLGQSRSVDLRIDEIVELQESRLADQGEPSQIHSRPADRAWMAVDGALLDILEAIMLHSVDAHELRSILEAATEPSLFAHWPRFVQILTSLVTKVPGPSVFFDFSGSDAGLLLPAAGLPLGGFTFSTWLRVEAFKNDQVTVLCLADHKDVGIRLYFEPPQELEHARPTSKYSLAASPSPKRRLALEALLSRGRNESITFSYEFERKSWVHIALVLRPHMLWKDEVCLYVDGVLCETQPFSFPKPSGRLVQARVGTNPLLSSKLGEPEDALMDPSFFGQMATIIFFAEALSPTEVRELFQLGVNACTGHNAGTSAVISGINEGSVFQPSSSGAETKPVCQRGDEFVFAKRAVPLWMFFSPSAIDGQLCINTCSLLPQDSASLMPGVLQRQTHLFMESLAAIGGVRRLMLLLVPLDFVNELCRRFETSLSSGVEEEKVKSAWFHRRTPSHPGRSGESESLNFFHDPAPFFDLLLAMGEADWVTLEHDISSCYGLHLLGYLLDAAILPTAITVRTTRSIAALIGYVLSKCGTSSRVYRDALRNLLLNWRIWFRCPEPVQKHILTLIQGQVRARPSFFHAEFGLEYFVDLLRYFLWLQTPSPSLSDSPNGGVIRVSESCVSSRLDRESIVHLRALVLQIAGAMMEGTIADLKSMRDPSEVLTKKGSLPSLNRAVSSIISSRSSSLMSLCTEEVAYLCSYLRGVLGNPDLDTVHGDSSFETALAAAAASKTSLAGLQRVPDPSEALDVVAVFGPAMLRYFQGVGSNVDAVLQLESPEQILRLWRSHAVAQTANYPFRPSVIVSAAYEAAAVERNFVRAVFDMKRDMLPSAFVKLDMSENSQRMHRRVVSQRRGTSHVSRCVIAGEEEAVSPPALPSVIKVRDHWERLGVNWNSPWEERSPGLSLGIGLALVRCTEHSFCRREGFLVKRGKKRKNWRTRYFLLQNSTLTYQNSGGQLCGSIDFDEQPENAVAVREYAGIRGGKFAYCFEVDIEIPKPRTYCFAARTRTEMEEWMRDILAACPGRVLADPARVEPGAPPWVSLLTNVLADRLHVTQSFIPEEFLIHKAAAGFVDVLDETPGIIELTVSHMYWFALDGSKRFCWPLSHFVCVYRRPYLLCNSALELFVLENRSVFLNFYRNEDCVKALAKLTSVRPPRLINRALLAPEGLVASAKITQRWCDGKVSNFDYLMALNTLSGRSQRCLNQYPVFPWVLCDFESEVLDFSDPKIYRDLSKPMGALNPERLEGFKERYAQFEDVFRHMQEVEDDEPDDASGVMHTPPPFHYATHYSNSAGVLSYLMRLEPYTTAFAQLGGGKFDRPERMFLSVGQEWHSATTTTSNVKELVPEFYYLPEFLTCHNGVSFGDHSESGPVGDVELPPWANGSAEEFVRLMRKALESEQVSSHLHEWIDLIFGYKQAGPEAFEACNTFHYLTYHGSVNVEAIEDPTVRRSVEAQILNFGLCPLQLFNRPHPVRQHMPGGLTSLDEVPEGIDDDGDLTQLPLRDSELDADRDAKFNSQIGAEDLKMIETLSRDLTQKAVSEAALSLILHLLVDPDVGVEVKTRRHRLISYQDSFVGSEAVTWMVKRLRLRSRAEAVALGQLLVLRGAVRHVNDEYGFKDKGALYRFAGFDQRPSKSETDLPRLNEDIDDTRIADDRSSIIDGRSRAPLVRRSTRLLASSVYTFPILPRSRACPVISLTRAEGSPYIVATYADGTVAMNKFTLEPDGRGSPFTLLVDRSAANPYVTADTYSGLSGAKRIRMAISRDTVRTSPNCVSLAGIDGQVLLSCGNPDQSFCAFELTANDIRPYFVVAGEHRSTITALAVDREILVTGSEDMTVKVWDISRISQIDSSSSPFGGKDGDEFVSEGETNVKVLLRHRIWGHVKAINSVAVLCNEDVVASASRDGTTVLSSLRRGRYLRTIRYSNDLCGPVGNSIEVHEPIQLKLSVQGLLISVCAVHASGHRDAVAAALHVHTLNGVQISSRLEEFPHVMDMVVSSDGHFLVTCGPEHVVIRQLPHLVLVRRFSVQSVVYSVCLSADEQFIFAGLQDGQLQVLPLEKMSLEF